MCWVGHFVPRSGETSAPGCPWLGTSQSRLPWGVVKSQSCQADWGRTPSACAGVVGVLQGAGRDGRHCHGLLLLPYLRTVHVVSMQPQPSYGKQAGERKQSHHTAHDHRSHTLSAISFWLHASSFAFSIITQHMWVYSTALQLHAPVMMQHEYMSLPVTLHLTSVSSSRCKKEVML